MKKKLIEIPPQFVCECLSIRVFRVTQLRIDINNVSTDYYKNTTKG